MSINNISNRVNDGLSIIAQSYKNKNIKHVDDNNYTLDSATAMSIFNGIQLDKGSNSSLSVNVAKKEMKEIRSRLATLNTIEEPTKDQAAERRNFNTELAVLKAIVDANKDGDTKITLNEMTEATADGSLHFKKGISKDEKATLIEERINTGGDIMMNYLNSGKITDDNNSPDMYPRSYMEQKWKMNSEDALNYFTAMQLDKGKNPAFAVPVIGELIQNIQNKITNERSTSPNSQTEYQLTVQEHMLQAIAAADKNGDGKVTTVEMNSVMKFGNFEFLKFDNPFHAEIEFQTL